MTTDEMDDAEYQRTLAEMAVDEELNATRVYLAAYREDYGSDPWDDYANLSAPSFVEDETP